ncbi:MAG: toll/interleukin-1 receptor domain-containing protein [Chloroflexi bacterium]|nr:toll/interleukin-1 receptor domain-containing protein [Chloroflexota bacterium]
MQIFITYAPEDETLAASLAYDLRRMGADVWLGSDSASSNDAAAWALGVEDALNNSDMLLVIASPSALRESYIASDFRRFLTAGRPVMVATAATCPNMPELLRRRNPVDFSRGYTAAFHRLTTMMIDRATRSIIRSPLQAAITDDLIYRYQRFYNSGNFYSD